VVARRELSFARLQLEPGQPGFGQSRKVWFAKQPDFDQAIHQQFLSVYGQAAQGQLDAWQETATGSLALILLLDQFPRHLFRGQPQSFATDEQARAIARAAIAYGLDQQLPPIQTWFLYMPWQHSENLEDQLQSVKLFQALAAADPQLESAYQYAVKHWRVIRQFGRFPHRNTILGRESTPEEVEFLKQPGSSF
jgi:uncharacterized protein (DUF924 family)